jgi:hypothetical protein
MALARGLGYNSKYLVLGELGRIKGLAGWWLGLGGLDWGRPYSWVVLYKQLVWVFAMAEWLIVVLC